MFEEIKKQLEKRGIPISKVYGLGTDGAAAMTGRKKGLAGQFLKANPHVKNTHCSAHRVALVSEQAAVHVPALAAYRQTVTNIYYFFHK